MPIFDDEQDLLAHLRPKTIDEFWLHGEYLDGKLYNIKFDIIHGMVRFLPRKSPKISIIQTNLNHCLYPFLSNTPYMGLFSVDVKIDDDNILLPDFLVITDNENHDDYIENPVLIADILTPINKYTLLEKFELYKALPSLQDYLLIDSENKQIWHYKKATHWQEQIYHHDDTIPLSAIYVSLNVRDIYHHL